MAFWFLARSDSAYHAGAGMGSERIGIPHGARPTVAVTVSAKGDVLPTIAKRCSRRSTAPATRPGMASSFCRRANIASPAR